MFKFFKKNNNKKNVWGVSYSVFDGEELLEASLRSIRKDVDYINVVYQKKNWYETVESKEIEPLCQKLKNEGLIDEILEYVPNKRINAGEQEKNKRILGLKKAKEFGCNYFMTMDVDEFYESKDIENAKKYILENDITHSYCLQYKYTYLPTSRRINFVGYVGFFCKINDKSTIEDNKCIPVLMDPTRIISHFKNAKYYVLPGLKMHHFEFVRNDLDKKIKSSSWGGQEWKFPPKDEGESPSINGIIKVDNILI